MRSMRVLKGRNLAKVPQSSDYGKLGACGNMVEAANAAQTRSDVPQGAANEACKGHGHAFSLTAMDALLESGRRVQTGS